MLARTVIGAMARTAALVLASAGGLAGTGARAQQADLPSQASPFTRQVFARSAGELDWADERDFANAERGLVARYPAPDVRDADGRVVWTFPDYAAMRRAAAPPTVHPLLWRQQQLNAANGLFKVTDGVYQLRGFDLANMTVIEGDSGLIVVDPLTTVEVARAALELYFMHRPRRPVVAVIYTHNHVDHFGGVAGVVAREDVESGRVAIYAPAGFLREAVGENVTAGTAMLRRTIYYSGVLLPRTEYGSVGAGLGPGVSNGRQSFIAPTVEIAEPGETRVIDGIEFRFQLANDTEAPAEMVFYLPRFWLLDMAEVAVHTAHNVLTPRGAPVRDTEKWWKAIDRAMSGFGGDAEVLIGQHHWPTWGSAEILEFLGQQRDFYKLVHDRSLNLINRGEVMNEVGAALERNAGLAAAWPVQDYYGTLGSAGKAVYQRYLGWYDGNPAHLDQLPDRESARRYVEYMGGAEAVLARARGDFARGEYRWVAEVLGRLVFAEPDNAEARELQAETLTQLGYQQVSATWRNVYLMAALELRGGVVPIPQGARARDYIGQMPPEMLLDYAGVALSPSKAAGKTVRLNFDFGEGRVFAVTVADGLLLYRAGSEARADATVVLDNRAFDQLLGGGTSFEQAVAGGLVRVEGDAAQAGALFTLFDRFTPDFHIVTP